LDTKLGETSAALITKLEDKNARLKSESIASLARFEEEETRALKEGSIG
jgi:hypothetical protein